MNMGKMILLEIAYTTTSLIIVSSIFGLGMFKEHPITWLFLIGVIMVIANIGSLPFISFDHAVASCSLGVVLIVASWAFLTLYIMVTGYLPPGYPPINNYELAKKCNSTEWVVMLNYYDKFGSSHGEEFNFVGRTESADEFVKKVSESWKNDNPKSKIRSIEKILVCIPKDYYNKHAFEKERHNQCPIEQ